MKQTTRLCPFCGCKETFYWLDPESDDSEKFVCECEECRAFTDGSSYEEAWIKWENGEIEKF